MKSWPLGVKIGAAVAAVLLVLVLWIALRRPEASFRTIHSAPRSARVQDRLERLRQEWAARGLRDRGSGDFRDRSLPRGALARRPGLPADNPVPDVPEPPPMFAEEPDFDTLKRLVVSDPDPDKRAAAVMILGTSDNPEALGIITQALSDTDTDVRMTAVEALADLSGNETADAMQLALDDANPEVRFEALGALADLGGEHARTAVEKALNDSDPDVRALAEGVIDLEEMYDKAPERPNANADAGVPNE